MIGLEHLNRRLKLAWSQARANWVDAALAGIAAGISWYISQHWLGHSHPIFASMSALICIAPGLTNHGKQAIYVLIGVLTGVFVGEMTLLLPPMAIELRITIVAFLGLLIGSAYAVVPAIIIQAGVSSVMVLAMGAEVAGFTRVIDVMVGTGIGLLFSQVLFTPDPIKALRASVERFFRELANNYTLAANALDEGNVAAAVSALKSCSRTHIALVALTGAIDVARDSARWTLRGRIASKQVTALSVRYDQAAIRLYAVTLLFSEALVNALRKQAEPPPEWLSDAIRAVADNCRVFSGEGGHYTDFSKPDRSIRSEVPISWRNCVNDIEMTENTIARFYKSRTRKARLQAHKRKQILDAVRAEVEQSKKEKLLALQGKAEK
ncbi:MULTISPECIES: FUSC family protein [unclassified Bartonella]|uniref:FUSC family protein n=1 Tax=unclassified Bartonella TaxID=2645622 RepID=UPI0015FA969A|nr:MULTISPECIES: FUSC family protein [unclassified Bartonella]UXN04001.1 FUSC family protein [Bartonella sp. HY406]